MEIAHLIDEYIRLCESLTSVRGMDPMGQSEEQLLSHCATPKCPGTHEYYQISKRKGGGGVSILRCSRCRAEWRTERVTVRVDGGSRIENITSKIGRKRAIRRIIDELPHGCDPRYWIFCKLALGLVLDHGYRQAAQLGPTWWPDMATPRFPAICWSPRVSTMLGYLDGWPGRPPRTWSEYSVRQAVSGYRCRDWPGIETIYAQRTSSENRANMKRKSA